MALLDFFASPDPRAKQPAGTKPSIFHAFLTPGPPPSEFSPPPQFCATQFQNDRVTWCLNDLPLEAATKHFLACGCPGSGKTVTLRLFLQSIVPRIDPARAHPDQIILFDAKRDMLDILAGIGLPAGARLWNLNPFDAGSIPWDIAHDIRTPAAARYFAALLVPPDERENAPYFTNAARQLVFAVLLAFIEKRNTNWAFRDLLCALRTKERILAITRSSPTAWERAASVFADERHFGSVLSTVGTKVTRFDEVAALWHHAMQAPASQRFTVRNFMRHGGLLLLGNHPVFNESLWPVNAMLLKVVTDQVLTEPETHLPRFWFILDEFRWMGRVDCIRQLLNQGRSKGVSITLGIQDVDGLAAAYGLKEAEEILSQCATKTFFRAGSNGTASWAQNHFNSVRRIERTRNHSESSGPGGSSTSDGYSESLQDRPLFLASVFSDMPLPEPGGWFSAIQDAPALAPRTRITRAPFAWVLSMLKKTPGAFRGLEPNDQEATEREAHEQLIQPWSAEEEAAFCGTAQPPRSSTQLPTDDDLYS